MPFFEFLPAELCASRLRKELTHDELVFEDGALRRPSRPGIGATLDYDALEEFESAAEAAARRPRLRRPELQTQLQDDAVDP
jgi:hypothetical protein